mgnify:CR=1 FL=1|tara:strand:- start:1362 stop:1730 length:369 start_codon:yes stop_codon:yes gene_type:complete
MNKNLKEIEYLAIIKAILKKEYPKRMSKNFSDRIMTTIYSTHGSIYNNRNIFTYGLRIASVFIFATITLLALENITTDQIQYTKSTITNNSSTPSKNVINNTECKDLSNNKPLKNKEIVKCK